MKKYYDLLAIKMLRVCIHLLLGTIWIFLISDTAQLPDRGPNILPFWDPEPRFDTIRRSNNRNTSTKLTNGGQKTHFHSHQDQETTIKYRQWNPVEENSKFRSKNDVSKDAKVLRTYHANTTENAALRMGYTKSKRNVRSHDHESTRFAPLQLMQQEKEKKLTNKDLSERPFVLTAYNCAEEYQKLLSKLTDADVETEVLGRTASYNDILLIKISHNGSNVFRARDSKYVENEPKQKKIIFIVHALSTMGLPNLNSLTVGNYLELLLSYYLAHLDKFDIYLMPMANPDGFIMARKKHYWNKNMSPSSDCPGVNLDRNFDVAWNSSSVMSSCSQHYPGTEPFSEPESRAVRDVLHRMSHKIAAYIHVHAGSYDVTSLKGDAILYPKGYTAYQSDDDKYIDLRGEIDEAIRNADFKVLSVTVDTLYNWYGQVSGSSVDYAATVYGIPYSMEMVMQLYQSPMHIIIKKHMENNPEELEFYALTEVWRRVIDVTFRNIYKNLEATEAATN